MIEFLISTMNRKDLSFLSKMFPDSVINDPRVLILVINQCTNIDIPQIYVGYPNVRVISMKERGLSKSRNYALRNSIGDICVVADDDFYYLTDCVESILTAYDKLHNAGMITFQTISFQTKKLRKRYKNKVYQYNFLSVMHVSSSDITFRRSQIINKNITFNEEFGLGSSNIAGEDNIFVRDCYNSGIKIYGYPKVILATPEETTGTKMIFYPELRGKIIKKLYPNYFIFLILCIVSSFRHYKDYSVKYSLFSYLFKLIKGSFFL